jgi:hypothetical protein
MAHMHPFSWCISYQRAKEMQHIAFRIIESHVTICMKLRCTVHQQVMHVQPYPQARVLHVFQAADFLESQVDAMVVDLKLVDL